MVVQEEVTEAIEGVVILAYSSRPINRQPEQSKGTWANTTNEKL